MQLMAKKLFYEVCTYNGQLRPGIEIDVQRSITYRGENADFKPFLTIPHKELEQRIKASIAEEKKIYDEMQKALKAWDEHGAQTLLLKKALEYLKTPEVKHTSNEWKQQKDGTWEISNMVYRMTFKIVEHGDEWKLSWELRYTAPGQPQERYYSYYDRGPKKRIEYEGSKKYKTMAGAQKYIQSKFDQYAHYFDTLSPPIPKSVKSLFSVNGQLLQGYFISRPQVAKEEVTVDDLLACLEAGDTVQAVVTAQERKEALPEEAASMSRPNRPTTKKRVHKKARSVPAR